MIKENSLITQHWGDRSHSKKNYYAASYSHSVQYLMTDGSATAPASSFSETICSFLNIKGIIYSPSPADDSWHQKSWAQCHDNDCHGTTFKGPTNFAASIPQMNFSDNSDKEITMGPKATVKLAEAARIDRIIT